MQVNGNDITMVSGDSEAFYVNSVEDGEPVAFVTGDVVLFKVKKYKDDAIPTIEKQVTIFIDGEALVVLEPGDTINLTGGYTYGVKVLYAGETSKTIITEAKFIIERGVAT